MELMEQIAGSDQARRRRLRQLAATRADPFQLLVGHDLFDGRVIPTENVHVQYLHLTDRLIDRVESGRYDRVVFLDKSARPVAWLMRSAWPVLGGRVEGERMGVSPRIPHCTFLNIDRLQWREQMDPQGVGHFDPDNVPDEPIAGLRAAFGSRPDSVETWLDGQRVLVVDEVRVSGDTAAIAAGLLQRAFPSATFETTQWMTPQLVGRRDGNRYNNQLPVWYRDDTVFGRGIGDRDPERSSKHHHWRTRSAAWFLSVPLTEPDPWSVRLRLELHALIGALLRREVLLVPGFDRADFDDRCRLFNSMDSLELRELRQQRDIILDP